MSNVKIYAFADEASSAIDKQVEAMKRNGLSGLEIRDVDGTNVSGITIEKAREVKKKMDANGLITWSIGSPIGKIGIADSFAPHLDTFKHTLDVAHELGAENIRMFSFFIPQDGKITDYREEVLERLGTMLDVAKGSGIRLCHENEKGIYGDVAERCLELHRAFPELRGIFDPANYVQCKVDTLAAWELLKEYIFYMHIKDAKEDGFVVPAGSGIGNVDTIVKAFIAEGGRNFTIEPHLTVFDGLKQLEREGERTLIDAYKYPDSDTAFDTACNAFKKILEG